MNTIQKWVLAIVVSTLLMVSSIAQAADPVDLIRSGADKVLSAISADQGLKEEARRADLIALIEKEIMPHVDFETTSKLTLGKQWRKASKDQRAQFIDVYKKLLIKTYSKSLVEYSDKEILFYPDKTKLQDNKGKQYAVVYSAFVPSGGSAPIPVQYKMLDKGGEWWIYDVEIQGLSLVQNYRTTFAKELNASSLDALIAKLESETDGFIPE